MSTDGVTKHPPHDVVIAYFADPSKAKLAIGGLEDAGFDRMTIHLIIRHEGHSFRGRPAVEQACPKSLPIWERIVEFFEATPVSGLYSKEKNETDSFRVAGQPIHGGYAQQDPRSLVEEQNLPAQRAKQLAQRLADNEVGAILYVVTDRWHDAESILRDHEGEI